MSVKGYSIIKCPVCQDSIEFLRSRNLLVCNKCKNKFSVRNYVPELLPPKIRALSSEMDRLNHNFPDFSPTRQDLNFAKAWLAEELEIRKAGIKWRKARKLLRQLAYVLQRCNEMDLNPKETKLVVGMLGSKNMSYEYKTHIADVLSGSIEASGYELYEEIALRENVVKEVINNNTVLIEIGSGVGRLLHQYGSRIKRKLSFRGERYRRFLRLLYSYDSQYAKHLKLILGLDFERRMMNEASSWLKASGLWSLVRSQRIMQVLALASTFSVNINRSYHRIVTSLFQTLGNQLGEPLQIDMLKKAKELASPGGTVFISVFNASVFESYAESYYKSIEASVGKAIYCEDSVFLSSRGVFSLWFTPEKLRKLCKEAGFSKIKILSNDNLEPFADYDNYIKTKEQERFKKRAIFAITQV